MDCFSSEHYILLTVSIRRVKLRTRFSNQLLTLRRTSPRRAWPGKHGRSRCYHWVTPPGAQRSVGTDPPHPQGWGVRGIPKAPKSFCDYVLLQADQLGTGCTKGQPWVSVVSTREPCKNPVSPTRSLTCSAPRRSPFILVLGLYSYCAGTNEVIV